MEREYIETVLRQNEGHRGKTARALGIDPKTLYNKLGPERPRKKARAERGRGAPAPRPITTSRSAGC